MPGRSKVNEGYVYNKYKSWKPGYSEGNRYCARDYPAGAPDSMLFHYSKSDGSYYYSNPDGSTYYNDGRGHCIIYSAATIPTPPPVNFEVKDTYFPSPPGPRPVSEPEPARGIKKYQFKWLS